jgi:membrane protease YdiL (CAAX protease family)
MYSKQKISAADSQPRPFRAYEIVVLWLAALAFWDAFFSLWSTNLPNIQYLTFPATGLTVIKIIKRNAKIEKSSFQRFIGRNLSSTDVFTALSLTPAVVATGVGGWSLLVLIGANINPDRTYSVWHLISESDFRNISWSPSWIVIEIIAAAIVAPILEEIVFRGILLQFLLKKYSVPTAISITSILFALLHFDKSFISAFIHSIIFSVLAIRFSSLYAPMLLHGFYNLSVSFLRIFLGVSLIADKNRFSSISYWAPELIFFAIGLLLLLIYSFHACTTRARFTDDISPPNEVGVGANLPGLGCRRLAEDD